MVKNIKGGNKAKGYSRNINKSVEYDTLEEGQLFGVIQKNLGGHFRVLCSDGIERNGKAINKIKNAKDKRLNIGTTVIVSLREFEKDNKNCDIINFAPLHIINSNPLLKVDNDLIKQTDVEFINTIPIEEEDNLKGTNEDFDISEL
jgi:initiation factor 1A